jgi:hypothetical protein
LASKPREESAPRFGRPAVGRRWLNAVKTAFLGAHLPPAVCLCSIVDLQAAIHRYLAEHKRDRLPLFRWTRGVGRFLAKK